MKRIFLFAGLAISMLFSTAMAQESSSAEKKENASAEVNVSGDELKKITYVICKNKSVVRTVRVNKEKSGACKTTYSKEGVESVVAESQWPQNCSKVLVKIRANLEKADWKCKDISEARVSSFNE